MVPCEVVAFFLLFPRCSGGPNRVEREDIRSQINTEVGQRVGPHVCAVSPAV